MIQDKVETGEGMQNKSLPLFQSFLFASLIHRTVISFLHTNAFFSSESPCGCALVADSVWRSRDRSKPGLRLTERNPAHSNLNCSNLAELLNGAAKKLHKTGSRHKPQELITTSILQVPDLGKVAGP